MLDNELGPEMDKLFGDFMNKIQNDPESANAFENMGKMFEQVFQGGENGGDETEATENLKKMMGGMMGGEGEAGGPEGQGFDKMTDMLLSQFMDKELLYEPLTTAKKEISLTLEKAEKGETTIDDKDKEQMTEQLACVNELVTLFDENSGDKEKMIEIFERMNNVGSLFEVIKKYSPDSEIGKNSGLEGLGPLAGMMGGGMPGGPGGAGGPNPEDCNLI